LEGIDILVSTKKVDLHGVIPFDICPCRNEGPQAVKVVIPPGGSGRGDQHDLEVSRFTRDIKPHTFVRIGKELHDKGDRVAEGILLADPIENHGVTIQRRAVVDGVEDGLRDGFRGCLGSVGSLCHVGIHWAG